MRILAIDPGPTQSAWVLYDPDDREIMARGIRDNGRCLVELDWYNHQLVIEMVRCYGMHVGASVFETCVWIGRFIQCGLLCTDGNLRYARIYRQDVFRHLLGKPTGSDAQVRHALIDRFPPTGGGKTPQIGTKKQPGPLYGLKRDMWQALGVAITWQLMQEQKQEERLEA